MTVKQIIIEPFHAPTRILMKLADSVSSHEKSKNDLKIDIFTIKLL